MVLRDVKLKTDEALLAAYQRGDDQAFAELVNRYQLELYTFLLRFTGDGALAEDLFQETFLQIHRTSDQFDPQRAFRPWLFTIAANKARDLLRSSARRTTQSLDKRASRADDASAYVDLMESPQPGPQELTLEREEQEIIQELLARMPVSYREVLLLFYFQHFSYKQIAESLQVPLGTIKSRLHAAVAAMAKAWQERQEKPPSGA